MQPGSQRLVITAVLEARADSRHPEVPLLEIRFRGDTGEEDSTKVSRAEWKGIAPGDELVLRHTGREPV